MDKQSNAVVVGRHRDKDGNLVGRNDPKPILNTALYDVAFPDGTVKQYAAHNIAENMFSQVDHDGHMCLLMDLVTGY